MRPVILCALLALAACKVPAATPALVPVDEPEIAALPASATLPAEQAAVAAQLLPEAVSDAADAMQTPVLEAVAAIEDVVPDAPPPPPPVDDQQAECRRVAAALIVRWEVSGRSRYERALRFPVWPGGASGVTWGIGYDGGHQTRAVILDDWQAHAYSARLSTTAGITGKGAKIVLPTYRDIPTDFDYANQILIDRSLVEYERQAYRGFGAGMADLRPKACGALVSLVYNRGIAMSGDSRREMRTIRDCVPRQDYDCIAGELRGMKRLWRGTVNEKGLSARREAEALLVESTE